jgi:hypothetical protein
MNIVQRRQGGDDSFFRGNEFDYPIRADLLY